MNDVFNDSIHLNVGKIRDECAIAVQLSGINKAHGAAVRERNCSMICLLPATLRIGNRRIKFYMVCADLYYVRSAFGQKGLLVKELFCFAIKWWHEDHDAESWS
jgi:hypothetical protein